MAVTDAELEKTRKQSEAIAAQVEELNRQAFDPNKQFGPLFDKAQAEFAGMREVLRTKGTKPGTGLECLIATVELIDGWTQAELVVEEAMDGIKDEKPAARPAVRRGMRI